MRRPRPVPAGPALIGLALAALLAVPATLTWAQAPPRSLGPGTGRPVVQPTPGWRYATPGPNSHRSPIIEGRRPSTPEDRARSATAVAEGLARNGPVPDVASRPGETVEQAHRRAGLLPRCELDAGKPVRLIVRGQVREITLPPGACLKHGVGMPVGKITFIEMPDGQQAAFDKEGKVLTENPNFDWLREALR